MRWQIPRRFCFPILWTALGILFFIVGIPSLVDDLHTWRNDWLPRILEKPMSELTAISFGLGSAIFGGLILSAFQALQRSHTQDQPPSALSTSKPTLVNVQCLVFSDDSSIPKHHDTRPLEVGKPTPVMLNWKENIVSGYVTYRVSDPYHLSFSVSSPYDEMPPRIDPPQELGATIYAFKILNNMSLELGITPAIPQVSEQDGITIIHKPPHADHR